MARTPAPEIEQDASTTLEAVLRELGLEVRAADGALELELAGRDPVRLAVHGGAAPQIGRLMRLLESHRSESTQSVFVADELALGARDVLDRAGWGWLDRRGHLKLRVAGLPVVIDAAIEPVPRRGVAPSRAGTGGIRGRGGLAYACAALLDPGHRPSVRGTAAWAHLAPSSVSEAKQALVTAALVDSEGRALVPELFWALVDVWRPHWVRVARAPEPTRDGERLGFAGADVDRAGWALTDTLGAAAWGAPLAAASDYPAELYVPSNASLDRAVLVLGAANLGTEGAAALAVAPLPGVCEPRYERGAQFPVTHPLFVALDVAADPSRGREALEWSPSGPGGFSRVW